MIQLVFFLYHEAASEAKLELITDIDMLLMIEKGIICGICHIIRRYVKANNKCKKYYDKQKNHLRYCYINNLHEYAMQRKLRVGGFK